MMWFWIGLGIVAALAFMFVMFAIVPKVVLKRVQAKLEARIAAEIPADQIVRQDVVVISLGLDSRGVTQARGNGALVLTPTQLRWLQLKPQRNDVTIPLASITTIDTKTSHLGKSYGKPLLHVTFARDGAPDSIAWYTTDVAGWIASLTAATSDHPPDSSH
jgi:hypothetical protein